MLLEQEVANTTPGPVRAEESAPLHIVDLYALTDGPNYGLFGRLEGFLQFRGPREFAARAEERLD